MLESLPQKDDSLNSVTV